MPQTHAAYLHDLQFDLVKKGSREEKLVKWLSEFSLDANFSIARHGNINPYVAVISNLISRGLPTYYSKFLKEHFGNVHISPDDFSKALHIVDPRLNSKNSFWHLGPKRETGFKKEGFGSQQEKDFLTLHIPTILGEFGVQLMQMQRELTSIVQGSELARQNVDFSFEYIYQEGSRKGFILEVDGFLHKVEPNQIFADRIRDKRVGESTWHTTRISTNFSTITLNKGLENLKVASEKLEYFKVIKDNYENPIYEIWSSVFAPLAIARIQKTILEYFLSTGFTFQKQVPLRLAIIERDVPCGVLAVKDLQRYFNELFHLSSEVLYFPKVELTIFFSSEFYPETPNYSDELRYLNLMDPLTQIQEKEYDLLIDVSILRRPGIGRRGEVEAERIPSRHIAIVRSIHHPDSVREFYSGERIPYKVIAREENSILDFPQDLFINEDVYYYENSLLASLEYFLFTIFRYSGFKFLQVPILSKALQGKSCIGLLSTGGGKSLIFQLAGLLQPGITLIVNPIKSLMLDQYDELNKIKIDSSSFINSKLSASEKREVQNRFQNGEFLFTFVSPERFVIEEFRKVLVSCEKNQVYFGYVVIDEAHCVSEWGHDFRTAYLALGRNAMEHCKTKSGEKVPLLALTATASFDVLADIQRELKGKREEDKVLEEDIIDGVGKKIRHELNYQIIPIDISEEQKRLYDLEYDQIKKQNPNWPKEAIERKLSNIQKAASRERLALGKEKQKALKALIVSESIPTTISEINNYFTSKAFDELLGQEEDFKKYGFHLEGEFFDHNCQNGGIIFCPHKSGPIGVTDDFAEVQEIDHNGKKKFDANGKPIMIPKSPKEGVWEAIVFDKIKSGFFMGADHDDERVSKKISQESFQNQSDFKDNKLNLLVATKAFGMGINKANIRYTVHMNYPSALESYVQEAGRAGRDGKVAISYILFSNTGGEVEVNNFFFNNSFKGRRKEFAVLSDIFKRNTFPEKENFKIIESSWQEEEAEWEPNIWYSYTGEFKDYFHLKDAYTNNYKGWLKINGTSISSKTDTPEIVEFNRRIEEFIEAQNPKPTDYNLFLRTKSEEGLNQDGIFDFLAKHLSGDFYLPASNNHNIHIEEAKQFCISKFEFFRTLNPNIDITFLKDLNFSSVENFWETFRLGLGSRFRSWNDDWSAELGDNPVFKKLEHIIGGIRDKSDTAKLVYRLMMLGVIEDYTIDFRTGLYKLKVVKRSNQIPESIESFDRSGDGYINHFYNYLKRYYSDLQCDKIISQVIAQKRANSEEPSLLILAQYLVAFIYEEIAEKRLAGISVMRTACQEGKSEFGKPEGMKLKEFIFYYFNSKYARKGFEASVESNGKIEKQNLSLADRLTDERRKLELEILNEFLDVVGNQKDKSGSFINNVKHLRGATNRLISSYPNNFALLFLRAFSCYCLDSNWSNQILRKEAEKDFEKGYELGSSQLRDDFFQHFFELVEMHFEGYKKEVVHEYFENLLFKMDIEIMTKGLQRFYFENQIVT
jgi:ATP-dependent DNA helicase RecQ